MLMTLFRALPIAYQLAAGAVALSLIAGGATAVYFHIYNKGWNDAIAGVASRNTEHLRAVKKAVSSVDECSANGGFWNTVSGVCQ